MTLVSLDDIYEARKQMPSQVFRTPLVPFGPSDIERPLWLKAESLQPTGAFKMRGAYNKILRVAAAGPVRGIVAQSSGNHGRAVAYVAKDLGLKATIVMPMGAPEGKISAIRALGAEVIIVTPAERDIRAAELVDERGYISVPPYDDVDIIAGQGTLGLEIIEECPDVDVVLCPIGGGGLISGVATAVKSLRPSVRVIGVEPELAADAQESLRSGRRVQWDVSETYRTVADGLRTAGVGYAGWEHIHALVDDIVTVSESEIYDAVYRLATDVRLVAETSGAAALAAYLNRGNGTLPATGNHVAIVSGGSIDALALADILRSGPSHS
jgi:threonine dehydratase